MMTNPPSLTHLSGLGLGGPLSTCQLPMEHAKGSPLPVINRAWRKIVFGVVLTVASYKYYVYKTRLQDDLEQKARPGAFTGEYVDTVERKSKYEGAGNSYMGRARGNRFTWGSSTEHN